MNNNRWAFQTVIGRSVYIADYGGSGIVEGFRC